jgi:hypothetical protein
MHTVSRHTILFASALSLIAGTVHAQVQPDNVRPAPTPEAAPAPPPAPYVAPSDAPPSPPSPPAYVDPKYPSPTYYGGRVVPYHVEQQRMWGLFGGGLGVFGASWMITAISGYAADHNTLIVPILGPLIMLGQSSCDSFDGSCNKYGSDHFIGPALVMSAIVQSSGLAMTIAGAVSKRAVRVIDRLPVMISPSASANTIGLTAGGRF